MIPEPPDPEGIRERHFEDRITARCAHDEMPWPCDVEVALGELGAMEAE